MDGSPIIDMHWREISFSVPASLVLTDSTTILFHSLTPTGYAGPVVDNVGVDFASAAPEPTSIALIALGGLGLLARRRRR
jgi:hypothetical protein